MNARQLLLRIFELKFKLDLADLNESAYIQRQIDEQLDLLQAITSETKDTLRQVIDKRYVEWLDGKFPDLPAPPAPGSDPS
jgi:hypothetical protein